jgi:hypothetical protein
MFWIMGFRDRSARLKGPNEPFQHQSRQLVWRMGFAFYAYRPGRFAVSLRAGGAGSGTGRCITFCEGSQP